MTHTTWIPLVLAWWPSSQSICTRVCRPCILATTTIQGWRLFVGGIYLVSQLPRPKTLVHNYCRFTPMADVLPILGYSQPTSCMLQLLCLPWPPSWFVVMCEATRRCKQDQLTQIFTPKLIGLLPAQPSLLCLAYIAVASYLGCAQNNKMANATGYRLLTPT